MSAARHVAAGDEAFGRANVARGRSGIFQSAMFKEFDRSKGQ